MNLRVDGTCLEYRLTLALPARSCSLQVLALNCIASLFNVSKLKLNLAVLAYILTLALVFRGSILHAADCTDWFKY